MENPSNFNVYEHWRTDKNQCFYVGKGKGRRRSRVFAQRNPYHTAIVAKVRGMGLEVEIRVISDGMTESEALRLEIERIALWKNKGVRLANLTSGGEGTPGHTLTDETKSILREHAIKNFHTFKEYQAMGPKAMARAVVCLDDGMRFPSASAAARHYKVSRSALIELCLKKNYRQKVSGLRFEYVDGK